MYIENTFKMAQFVKLDSANRALGSSYDCVIKMRQPMRGKYALRQVYLPVDYYNINAKNNAIYFRENATNKTAHVQIGYYDSTSISAAVLTAMQTASGGYNTFTVSIDPTTQNMSIIAGTNPFQLMFQTTVLFSMASLLGYPAIDTAAALTQTSTSAVNLNPVKSFNILLNNAGGMISSSGGTFSFTVPISAGVGGITVYEPPVHFQQIVKLDDCYQLHCQIFDDYNVPLQIQSDWYMILEPVHTEGHHMHHLYTN